ncbi:MAG: phosphodiester glycosidase family protein [Erysipelotrichaceae bacterium]|nr:phosphodiester glycosidase family protein [Erysipelotrichaceae bacterium]MDY5252444.1 phosphodiester glycosidase family protein [Erysipelotrichaceae bacterium]
MAKRLRLKASIKRRSKKSMLVVLVIILAIMINAFFATLIIFRGPSKSFSNLIISTFMETRRGKSIVELLFSDEEIEEIMAKNNVHITNEITDYTEDEFIIDESVKDKIDVIDVSGDTFKGKLMIVYDPSRIDLGVNSILDPDNISGHYVEDYVNFLGGVGGINAGGFDDPGGKGDGSIPQGIVIKDGELIYGTTETYDSVIGFNKHNRLVVGQMTGQQALDYGLVNAVTFGPPLIINYEPQPITGTGGGLNPRTVIGQREDGAVLLLVIDGRQTTSLGATYLDCIEIMLEYGAMNAANLDGGHSSCMVYEGEIINNPVSLYGEREVPTAWVVK